MNTRRILIILSLVGLAGAFIGLLTDQTAFFQAYLVGFSFWIAASLGCLALLLTYNITGGPWGEATHRLMATGAQIMPLTGVLFLPLIAGLPLLYDWAQPEIVAGNHLLEHRAVFMNTPYVLLRTFGFLTLWSVLGWLLSTRWVRRRVLSSLGLVIYLFTVTIAAMDWLMSIDTEWHSLIYGVLFIATCMLIATSLLLALGRLLNHQWSIQVNRDLASLLLTAVVVWGYLMFMQYLVIWSGNLPEEIVWYINRAGSIWEWVILLVVMVGFAAPCFLLFLPSIRQSPRRLAVLSACVCLAHLGQMLWLIKPSFGAALHWLDLVLPAGMGGLWLLAFYVVYDRYHNRHHTVAATNTPSS
ncbi:MAG: hypothetical protein CL610_07125 [Anaerolineaceae bacterium]|nr:hypothetical protein [Anaerolineaceae bacterium]